MAEKLNFTVDETGEVIEFYILEQTKVNNINYLLVTETEEDGSEAYILKDLSDNAQPDSIYEFVEDDDELRYISKIFAEMLEDVTFN